MTTSTLNIPQRGWFDVLDDQLKRDRFIFVVGLDYFFFSTAYLAIGGCYWHNVYLAGTHGLASSYLEGANFQERLSQRLLMLWVILFFYFSPESREISSAGSNLGTLEFCGAPRCLRPIGFMLRQFELARLIGIRPYNAIAFSGPIAVFVSVFLIYPLGQSELVLCAEFWCVGNIPILLFLQGFHNWTLNPSI